MTTATMRITAEPGTALIETEREVNAPRDLVFRAWTDPVLLAQWLGPRRLTMRVDTYDVRHGGAWRYVHLDADGTEYGFRGVFHGEPTPDRIVQTFEFEGAPGHVSLDTLVLEDLGGRTLVRTISAYQGVEARDAMLNSGMAGGMDEGYAQLDELLARLQA
ncbi:MAG TPA: SRPBCC family protein [Candidatus Limnocylindrales bacterium]|nr:SRPBCC family protein [Candidatus Limnocylindrales bacterium]